MLEAMLAKDTTNNRDLFDKLFTYRQQMSIWDIRAERQMECDTLSVCDGVCGRLHRQFGWDLVEGEYESTVETCLYHCWLMMPGGIIFDPTADQFELDGVCLICPEEPEYGFYKPKCLNWTQRLEGDQLAVLHAINQR